MGSVSRMNAIDRFIEKHEFEIRTEVANHIPTVVRELGPEIELMNNCDEIEISLAFRDPNDPDMSEWLDLDPISIYELEQRDADFGDCCNVTF